MDKIKSILQDKKVIIKPIKRQGSWLEKLNPNHSGVFMFEGTSVKLSVPRSGATNKLIDPLKDYSEEAKEHFCKILSLKEDDINIHKEPNFWTRQKVTLNKHPQVLNLNNIDDVIKYLVLKVNTEHIAPSWNDKFARGTYRWALVNENEMLSDANKNIDYKQACYEYMGKYGSSQSEMYDFINIYYLDKKGAIPSFNKDTRVDYLRKHFAELIDKDPKGIVDILGDEQYPTKKLIHKAKLYKILTKTKHKYSVTGTDVVLGTLQETIAFLEDTVNSEDRIKLSTRIENIEEKV